ncbi:class I ribonucleotide reductase maintenance protein YfaE [Buchnera aphidicola]|uniref:class I ribonucleotide reductase maintenance protein YfaE n=1 Tax=Buchnera aphidicola TaxID=9 RepID=UPI0031B6F1CB
MFNKRIVLINKSKKIYVNKKNISLLKTLLINNINIEYQCQKGYCGTCRVILIKGKILYQDCIPLAFLRPKEILPCCCIIYSNVEIKI